MSSVEMCHGPREFYFDQLLVKCTSISSPSLSRFQDFASTFEGFTGEMISSFPATLIGDDMLFGFILGSYDISFESSIIIL